MQKIFGNTNSKHPVLSVEQKTHLGLQSDDDLLLVADRKIEGREEFIVMNSSVKELDKTASLDDLKVVYFNIKENGTVEERCGLVRNMPGLEGLLHAIWVKQK